MDESTQEYNVSRLIASNSILCSTIQKLEKRLCEVQCRVSVLDNVIADKDRQLDIVYHRMNELYNILRQKDTQIQRLMETTKTPTTSLTLNEEQMKSLTELGQQLNENSPNALPIIKVGKLQPLFKIPIPLYHIPPQHHSSAVPEVEMLDSGEEEEEDADRQMKEEVGSVDKNKNHMICVTRVHNIIKAVTAQKSYVDLLKKKNDIDLSSVVVEIKCKKPHKLWEETMKVCHKKYNNKVKLLRKSLKFITINDAEMFANEIKHMYQNIDLWDTNKIYMVD